MNKKLITLTFFLFLIVNGSFAFSENNTNQIDKFNYYSYWHQIDSLENFGLPRSALKMADVVYFQAKREKNKEQLIKSLIYKMKLNYAFEGDNYTQQIRFLENELKNSGNQIIPVLHSMLGEMYWVYFQNNRRRFYGRSKTNAYLLNDIQTWSLENILDKSRNHYMLSVDKGRQLKNLNLNSNFNSLLIRKKNVKSDEYSLFDFLAYRAIEFFKSEETNINKNQGGFDLNNKGLFEDVSEFAAIKFQTKDSTNHNYLIVRIFQQLISWHQKQGNSVEVVFAGIERLKYVYSISTVSNKFELYTYSLGQIKKQYLSDRFIWGEVAFLYAKAYYDRGITYNVNQFDDYRMDFKKSRGLCFEILDTIGSASELAEYNAKALIGMIGQKSMEIKTEDVLIPGQAFPALVSYRNLDSVFVRVLKYSYEKMDSLYSDIEKIIKVNNHFSWEAIAADTFKLEMPVYEYSYKLPQTSDYRKHSTEIILPALPSGQYVLLFSNNKTFAYNKNTLLYKFQPVSNLSYLKRSAKNGILQFCLLNRQSGEPLKGVSAKATYQKYNYRNKKKSTIIVDDLESSNDGLINIEPVKDGSQVWVDFKLGNDQLSTKTYTSRWERGDYVNDIIERERNKIVTEFFTDRAIYRPGQTIYFKGIVFKTDFKKKHKIKTNYNTSIELFDVNYQKIAEREVTTNEYGTFSGEFIIPQGLLTGRMTIQEKFGNHVVRIEEYKRPKFEVVFPESDKIFKLNKSVIVNGKAKAFSGASVGGAMVKYSVVRQIDFPSRRYFFNLYQREVEIKAGATETNDQGEFEISFTANPDLVIAKSLDPVYRFKVRVDITDLNGETHSSEKIISIGYSGLLIGLKLPELVKKSGNHKFEVISTNLEGGFVPARGEICIYRLKPATKPYKSRLWKTPDQFYYSENEYNKLLPGNEYKDESDFLNWDKGKKAFETEFNTEESKLVVFESIRKWKSGKYLVEIVTSDQYGEEIRKQIYFTLYSPNDKKIPFPAFDFYSLLDKTVEPGGIARIIAGSSARDVLVLFELEQDGKLLEAKWLRLDNQQKIVEIPIKENYAGNISINYVFVKNGRLYNHTDMINVPYSSKHLDIQFETFRDKLLPGENEEWRIKIAGGNGGKVAAEMVATLYDASLDKFVVNDFNFDLNRFWHSRLGWGYSNNNFNYKKFNSVSFNWNKLGTIYTNVPDQLNWFGFNYHYVPFSLINESGNKLLGSAVTVSVQKSGQLKVTGTIRTMENELLPGATIVVKGTSIGTVADIDGNFSLEYKDKRAVLVVSFIGYKTILVGVEGITKLDVKLAQETLGMDEVVAIGYGRRKGKSLAGAVSGVEAFNMVADEEEMDDTPAIRIRGTSSITPPPPTKIVDIPARSEFSETAFFYPHLKTNENGEIIIGFKIPESLTRWKMLGFAHTKDLKYGFVENSLVTSKSLMVVPNLPRFFREGDNLAITSKIVNISEGDLSGFSKLLLFDAVTMNPLDTIMGNINSEKVFNAEAGSSDLVKWEITIPEGIGAVVCKIVAQAGNFTDGEENTIPVLSSRMLVTETLPVWVRGNQTKIFTLDKLVNTSSETRRNHTLTFEFTANPAWYAIQALPYIMEYPYECMEQTFSKLYANSIATNIINSSPKIKSVFEGWKMQNSGAAFLSKLEKNMELKQVLLQETPWIVDAKNESERNNRLALLFDLNKMANEKSRAIGKLKQGQYSSGAWPWFNKGPESHFITQHIVSGFGHLKKLGVINLKKENEINTIVVNAIRYLDEAMLKEFNIIQKDSVENKQLNNYLANNIIHYLYGRSFFKDIPVPQKMVAAMHFYKGQIERYWMSQSCYMKGLIALTLYRNGNVDIPARIVKSLREFATYSEELGMYWKEPWGYYWYQAPVETQALMIEVFNEVANDKKAVDDLRVWLLKNKQVNDWKTTKATAEACYALLLGGTDWLTTTNKVKFTIANKPFDPYNELDLKVESGTGYFKKVWHTTEIEPDMGNVSITKQDDGISWGGLYWQYFEQLDKITSSESPLKISKTLFKEVDKKIIEPVENTNSLKIGDKVVVRIELRADREMEFIHLKDMRASCFEPVSVLSGYKYRDGLWYYESTKDASTNYFIDYLPKGTYVFEYPLWVTHNGEFSNGITTIQSMYAPEFSSHSEGIRVKVSK